MKISLLKSSILIGLLQVSGGVMAEGSVQHFGQSAEHIGQSAIHSAEAFGNTIVGSTKLVSGVLAVPFKGLGVIGSLSDTVGDFLWDSASANESLEISEETVTAGPAPFLANNTLAVTN